MIEFKNRSNADINNAYKPSDKEQSDRRSVYERYYRMRSARVDRYGRDLEAQWRKWLKQYDAWRDVKDPSDWQSNIVPPFTTTMVEKALAEVIDQTLQPTITARGLEDIPKAKIMNYIKDYTWEVGDGDLELYSAIKQAFILGKTVWQEDYWRDIRKVKTLKRFDFEKNEEEYVTKDITDFDDVFGENVSLFDFYLDPLARTINRGRYKAQDCIRRYVMNYDAFMETFKGSIFDQFGNTQYVKAGRSGDFYQYYEPRESINSQDQVEILWYWGRRPDKLIIVANDVVIRDGPNPYMHKQLPFAEGTDVPDPYSFYGKGEPALLESIQDELTTMRRMRIDRQHLDIWKMFIVSNRENLDEEDAIVSPSRFLYVDDPSNSIKALEYGDINPSAYREEGILKEDGREVTGLTSPQSSSTATEAAIHKESTMRALRLKIWLLSRELLTNVVRLRASNIVQFYSTPKVEAIVGEKGMTKYRQIRTTDTVLEFGRDGQVIEKKERGDHFFEIQPDMVIPYHGGYDFKLSAEPTLPVSKPLLQQKVNELSNNPIILSAIEQGYYSPGKIADQIMEVNDFDPEQFKEQQMTEEDMIPEETMYDLANQENQMIAAGQRVPPTPYASVAHTGIHLAYMDSDEFKSLPADQFQLVLSNMIYHALGEAQAQEAREKGGTQLPGLPTPPQQQGMVGPGVEGGETKASMPGRMIGAEGVPGM